MITLLYTFVFEFNQVCRFWEETFYIFTHYVPFRNILCSDSYREFPSFNIDPYRKNVSVVFFSETTEPFENKLDWHASWIIWMILYKICVCVDWKP
jgi:hypothetical protein